MLDLDDIITQAEESPRQTTDVEVVFNDNISAEIDALREQRQELNAQLEQIESDLASQLEELGRDPRASDPRPAEAREKADAASAEAKSALDEVAAQIEQVEGRAVDFLVTFRVTALEPFQWDTLTARSEPREGNSEDARCGYDSDEVSLIALKRGAVRLGPDGELIEVTAEQWDRIWKTLPAEGRRRLRGSVWFLHEYAGAASRNEAVIAARKVLAAREAATLPSPSDSGSTRGASPAGNRSSSRTTSTKTAA